MRTLTKGLLTSESKLTNWWSLDQFGCFNCGFSPPLDLNWALSFKKFLRRHIKTDFLKEMGSLCFNTKKIGLTKTCSPKISISFLTAMSSCPLLLLSEKEHVGPLGTSENFLHSMLAMKMRRMPSGKLTWLLGCFLAGLLLILRQIILEYMVINLI